MAGLSPSSFGGPIPHSVPMSVESEPCARPCNRICAHGESIVKLTKSIAIIINNSRSFDVLCLKGPNDPYTCPPYPPFSLEKVLCTLSCNVVVEKVQIMVNIPREYLKIQGVVLKLLFECLKTMPFLKFLTLAFDERLSISLEDAKTIFSLLIGNKVLQYFEIILKEIHEMDLGIVVELVDALLQNHFLQNFIFSGRRCIVEEITTRYSKAPNNVLTKLELGELSDIQMQQVVDVLHDNKQLKSLSLHRRDGRESSKDFWKEKRSTKQHCIGVGNIGEALCNNTVLECLTVLNTMMEVDEMKVLMRALVPDVFSKQQPNTSLLHLSFQDCSISTGGENHWMEYLTNMLRSNTSLISLNLSFLAILMIDNQDSVGYIEMLFISLWPNTSLEELELHGCSVIRGKQMLGIIGDMLLHNHTLMNIGLEMTGLDKDGDADLVHAELRARTKNIDLELMKQLEDMDRVPPKSTRVFLCGSGNAGKTTLCRKWTHIFKIEEKGKMSLGKKVKQTFFKKHGKWVNQLSTIPPDQTRGIEVHKMIWSGINVTVWDMAGQIEYHSFHDLVLPNQYANGGCCIYFIVCNPWEKDLQVVEEDLRYWLVFVASNTRRTKSYRPRVTILMTHHDLWGNDLIRMHLLKESVKKLRDIFQHVLDFDYGFEFIEMDNENQSHDDALRAKQHAEDYLNEMSSRMPKILKASIELQSVVAKWNDEHSDKPILRWDEFSKQLCEKAEEVRQLKDSNMVAENLLEKAKKYIASSLHDGGHIMYYEGLSMVITNPHWFCHDIMGNILFKCSRLGPEYGIASNGVISREHLRVVCRDEPSKRVGERATNAKKSDTLVEYIEQHFDEILSMMIKLQICYIDANDVTKLMIPAILRDAPTNTLSWPYLDGMPKQLYKGTKLTSKDETITSMTTGFFPRFQVYLHNKFNTPTYKLYFNVIYFIFKNIHIYITFTDGSINIMSQSCEEQDHDVHKMIITNINDFRAEFSSLGCPGVIFEEHIIWPKCVEHCLSSKDPRFQSVRKKDLKTMVLRCGDLEYPHHWKWDEHWKCAGVDFARDLFGIEEWEDILQFREQELKEMGKRLDLMLVVASNNGKQEPSLLAPKEDLKDDGCANDDSKVIMKRLGSISRKVDQVMETQACNHKELMESLRKMETNIICSQRSLATKVCSNIEKLMEFTLQLQSSKVPKLPYFLSSNNATSKLLVKVVPGLKSCHLHFMCEHKGGFHIVEQQPGCTIHFGTSETRKFEIAMNMGLTIFVMLLKIGAHLGAGMGSIVPDLAQHSMLLLDTPGLLDFIKPSDSKVKCISTGSLMNGGTIDDEVVQDVTMWLVERLKSSRKSKSIYEMFKLTKTVYTKKSSKKGEIVWVCDKHKRGGLGDGTLQIVQESI